MRPSVAVCPVCGAAIADARIESDNLATAYAAYRATNHLLSPEEIKAVRRRYGLSLRDFSRFLGFGEQTVARYGVWRAAGRGSRWNDQAGSKPRWRPVTFKRKETSCLRRSSAPSSFVDSQAPDRFSTLDFSWPPLEAYSPSRTNGYRPFDWSRVCGAVVILAHRCKNLYKTKLLEGHVLPRLLLWHDEHLPHGNRIRTCWLWPRHKR